MFKRILTVTLAVVLTLESPLTAYAAQTAPVQLEEDAEGQDTSAEDIAERDGISEEGTENPSEEEADGKSEASGETDENAEEPGKEEGNLQEPEKPGEPEDNPQEPGIEDALPEEPEQSGIDDGNPKDPEDITDTGKEDEISGEPADNLPKETESAVSENSVSNNTLSVEAFSLRASEKLTVTPLSFETVSQDGVEVTLPACIDGKETYVWYSFTAPKAGRYAFYSKEAVDSSIYFYLCAEPDKDSVIRNGTPQTGVSLCTTTNYMKEGETLYIGAYTGDGDTVFTLRAAYQTAFTKNSDGTYTAALPDGDSVTLKTRTGKSRFQIEVVTASARQYDLIPYYCPADHSEGDQYKNSSVYRADTSVQGATVCTKALPGGSYDAAFMIARGSIENSFAALLTGMDPFVIEGADSEDIMYVHGDVCEENSIALDMESLVGDSNDMEVWCHAADSGEKIGEIWVNPWMIYEFERLKAGTAYRFDIRDAHEDRILKSLTYSTKAASAQIEDATAEISNDFSKLIIKVKPSWQGTQGEGKLRWKMTDSLGQVHDASRTVDFGMRDAQGYFTEEIAAAESRLCLQPGAEYSIQMSMEFTSEEEIMYTETKTVKVKAPAQAFLKEPDVLFQVSQQEGRNERGGPKITVTAEVKGLVEDTAACCFYRSVDLEGEKYLCWYLSLESGKAEDSKLLLPSSAMGANYEFILAVGGVTKRVEFSIENELGVHLKRVEKATDETGPFHFVRTYEIDGKENLTDSYYLQLQALPLTAGSSQLPYSSIGKAVELSQANGYQATVSTLDAGWVAKQDIDYSLRWVLSRTENISYDANILAVAYEDLHTGKPHFMLEKLNNSSHASQGYQVSLAEADAVVREHGLHVPIYCYLRETGKQVYTQIYTQYKLKPENDYSYIVAFSGLRADTEYEFSLRDFSGEAVYATDVFRTVKDTRAVTLSKTEVYVERAKLYYTLSGFDRYTNDYVVCWYRQAGITGAWRKINAWPAKEDYYFTLSGLRENTAYEYVIGIGDKNDEVPYLTHTVRDIITTKTDTRYIEVSARTRMTSAKITYQMFDMGVVGNNIVMFFWRERGQEDWEKKAEDQYFTNEAEKLLSLEDLKENTVYEYRVGFAKDRSVTSAEDLKHVIKGELQTAEDRRTVEIVPETKAYSAKISYTLRNMEGADDGWLVCYLKKASEAGDTAWKKVYTAKTGEEPTEGMFMLEALEEETAYELAVGFGTEEDTAADSLRRATTFPFTTNPDSRSLSEAEAEVGDVNVTLRVKFSGNVDNHDSYVHFFYREKGQTKYEKAGRLVNLCGVTEETASVTLNGQSLLKSTEYEFIAVLTNGTSCKSPEEVTKDSYKAFGSFITPEAVKPARLIISQEQLYLNANAFYQEEKGVGFENLKVKWEPLEADADLVWESSDKAVATVAKDGKVTAVAAGKAVITATSAYTTEVSVSCEVIVGDYLIGRKGADGSVSPVEDAKLTVARGTSLEGYVLCKETDGKLAEVSASEIVSRNESIAQWADGVIEAKRAGEAKLVFTSETDQVQALLTVSVQPTTGKGFTIRGFTSNYYGNSYPALKEDKKDAEGREQYTMAYLNQRNIIYTALGEIMPSRPGFDSGDFDWSIDNTEVATVDGNGKIKPLKAGDALLRVEPKNADADVLYKTQVCEIVLHIKELPPEGKKGVFYALENTHKKLGDVKFPEDWAGWKWKSPDTPIVINGENRLSYSFMAVYAGEQYYPYERLIGVQIGRVTGITACEAEGGNHNNVLEVGTVDSEGNPTEGSDALTLCVDSLFNGDIDREETLNYTWKVEMNAPAGLVVKEGEYKKYDGRLQKTYTVTAVKKGNYTLTPVIKVTDIKTKREKVLAKSSFKIQAVEQKQAYITLDTVASDVVRTEQGRIVSDFGGSSKSFFMRAKLLDRNKAGAEAFDTVKLNWISSDKKVVTVKPSKDTHSAEIKIVGEGHAILTAKVKDKAGHTATAQIEIRNRAPRVSVSKVTVNPAYDYDSAEGRRLAFENGGAVEIVPAYNEITIGTIRLWKNDTKTPTADNVTLEPDLELVKYEEGGQYQYLIYPKDSAEDKVYDCYLGAEVSGISSEPFFYPLKVTVKTKQPQVTVKSVRPANLFYRTDPASVDISAAPKGVTIESVSWTDSAEGEGNGFASAPSAYAFDTTKKGKNETRLYFAQESLRLDDRKKPADAGIVSGKITISYEGYQETVEKPVSFKWNYKKPTIVVKEKQATLIPSLEGHVSGSFMLYNGEKKRLLYKNSGTTGGDDPRICYTELTFLNRDFIKSGFRDYTYVGSKTKGKENLAMTIVSDYWREPLSAVHIVKFANATPYLTKPKLLLNTGTVGTAYTEIGLKNAYETAFSCDDIIIEGKNAKSQALLDEDLLEMEQQSVGSSRIVVKLNRAQTMRREAVKNGTYDFKVMPCFRDASGNRIEGKALILKIQMTNKAVTAKVKLSGSLDLSKRPDKPDGTDTVQNYVDVNTTLQNIDGSYSYDNSAEGLSLRGEYSNYFSISYFTSVPGKYRIRINKKYESKLKAGQRYRLAVRFTLKLENGDTVRVQTPTFTIRPKQSAPKVIVCGNAQTLYAGKDNLVRTCGFELPEGMGYRIKEVSGGLDCNKDGKQDITLSWVKADSTDHYAAAQLKLSDRDGALTVSGMKGKTYKVPATITLQGRDGISKDVKTSIQVTVRR